MFDEDRIIIVRHVSPSVITQTHVSPVKKVVPTVYNARGRQIDTNQFSVTEHFKKNEGPVGGSLPGIFFFYDLSPIKVRMRPFREGMIRTVQGTGLPAVGADA